MLINTGTQERLIAEATTAAGTTVREGSIRSDSVLVSLWVGSVTSGSLSVTVYTLTEEGKEVDIITFPVVGAPTVELLLRKSAVSLQRFRVAATYTGVCNYEIYVRAIEGAGESSTRILGSTNWATDQVTVGTSPMLLIASSLLDRNGVVLKNWSVTQNVFVAESSAKLVASKGYPLAPRDGLALDIAAGAEVWAVADAAGADIRLAESGG